MAMLNISIKDSTGTCVVSFCYKERTCELAKKKGCYVKLVVNMKCGGLVYRPVVKRMGVSIVEMTDFNELTMHYL